MTGSCTGDVSSGVRSRAGRPGEPSGQKPTGRMPFSTRKRNFEAVRKALGKYDDMIYLPRAEENSEPCWFGFPITLKENCKLARADILNFLGEHGVATRLLFAGNLVKQPYFIDNKVQYRIAKDLKNTDLIMNNCFWVGVCPLIDGPRLDYLIGMLQKCLDG